MKTTPYDAEITELENVIKSQQGKLNTLLQKRVEYLSPFKIGQILIDNKGRKAKITKLKQYWPVGVYQLKDGTFGKVEHSLYSEVWEAISHEN